MGLPNASAIVTDGAGGFGAATLRRLAQMGAKVVWSTNGLPMQRRLRSASEGDATGGSEEAAGFSTR
jgi:NAD(P)-dependent dehydrogenase (short-subunit alcohol dehydrogenase family)